MDQTVELYCGAEKPFSQIAVALGYATFTVDVNPENQPSLAGDVSEALAKDIPASPLIVWAAPPYSKVFRSSECWESDGSLYPLTDEALAAINTVRETIRLIYALNLTWWFIEHPKSLVRKMPLFAGFNRGYPTRNRRTIKHSEYGPYRADETDIWTNAFWWIPRPLPNDEVPADEVTRRVPPLVYAEMLEQLDLYEKSRASR